MKDHDAIEETVFRYFDGYRTKGIETDADVVHRKEFLRKIGYKL